MNVSLSELQELVIDREAWHAVIHGVWHAVIHGVSKSWTGLSDSTELMTNDVKHLFLYIMAIWTSSQKKCLFRSLSFCKLSHFSFYY